MIPCEKIISFISICLYRHQEWFLRLLVLLYISIFGKPAFGKSAQSDIWLKEHKTKELLSSICQYASLVLNRGLQSEASFSIGNSLR